MRYRVTYKDRNQDIRLTEWTSDKEDTPDGDEIGVIIGHLVRSIGFTSGYPLAAAVADMELESGDPLAVAFYDAALKWVKDSQCRRKEFLSKPVNH